MNDYYQFRDETGTPIDYYQLVNDNNELCKEIERLNKELESLEKLNDANYKSFIDVNNILNELEEELEKELQDGRSENNLWLMGYYDATRDYLDKVNELKEKSVK